MRALLQRVVMPGSVHVSYTREPSYFAGEGIGGAVDRTLIHRHAGRIDGIGRFSAHTLHRNSVVRRIGYFGELRIDPGAGRSPDLLRDGYAALRQFVIDEGVEGCFTSIATQNVRARLVLEHGRRLGLPEYTPLAGLVTFVAPVGRAVTSPPGARRADDRDELTRFLERHASAAHLSISWDDARWSALANHGVDWRDFHVVREGRRIVAAGAVWDQRAFRQVVVRGYTGSLRLLRPFLNAAALLGLGSGLPAPGSVLTHAPMLGAAVEEPRHWAPLIRALRADAAARGIDWLAIARDARDPQLDALRRLLSAREYHTRLYDVRWPDMYDWPDPWNASPFRPEIGLL